MTVASIAGPELGPTLAFTLSLQTLLQFSVAAALKQPPQNVSLFDVTLTSNLPNLGPNQTGAGGMLAFDWSFLMCCIGYDIDAMAESMFESGFVQEAQSFATFFGTGTFALFGIERLVDAPTGGSTPAPESEQGSIPGAGTASSQQAQDGLGMLWWLPWVLALLLLILAFVFFVRRRRRMKHIIVEDGKDCPGRYLQEDIIGPDGAPLAWLPGAFALATARFQPEEHLLEAGFGGVCLCLEEGDVIEVEACGTIWSYGHIADASDRVGFFPASCVAWLGRPLQEELQAHTLGRSVDGLPDWLPPGSPAHTIEQLRLRHAGFSPGHGEDGSSISPNAATVGAQATQVELATPTGPKVHANCPFDPDEVLGTSLAPEQCLALKVGEEVVVVAAGAGWLYGCLAREPERASWKDISEDTHVRMVVAT